MHHIMFKLPFFKRCMYIRWNIFFIAVRKIDYPRQSKDNIAKLLQLHTLTASHIHHLCEHKQKLSFWKLIKLLLLLLEQYAVYDSFFKLNLQSPLETSILYLLQFCKVLSDFVTLYISYNILRVPYIMLPYLQYNISYKFLLHFAQQQQPKRTLIHSMLWLEKTLTKKKHADIQIKIIVIFILYSFILFVYLFYLKQNVKYCKMLLKWKLP